MALFKQILHVSNATICTEETLILIPTLQLLPVSWQHRADLNVLAIQLLTSLHLSLHCGRVECTEWSDEDTPLRKKKSTYECTDGMLRCSFGICMYMYTHTLFQIHYLWYICVYPNTLILDVWRGHSVISIPRRLLYRWSDAALVLFMRGSFQRDISSNLWEVSPCKDHCHSCLPVL